MTESKKWCDLCKIFISSHPSSIKNHDLSKRHKDNVTKRLANKREEKVAKYKEKKENARVRKASLSNQNNTSTFQKAKDSNATSLGAQTSNEGICELSTILGLFGDWERDMSLGYYYNPTNGCCYDPNSGFYYTDALGKWVTLKEILAAALKLSSGPTQEKYISATSSLTSKSQTESKAGQCHKDNATKRVPNRRQEKVVKESRSYENNISRFHKETDSNATSLSSEGIDACSSIFGDWEHDMSSGYYYNLSNSCFYDPNSGFYYTHDLGKWVTLKEAVAAVPKLQLPSPTQKKPNFATSTSLTSKIQTLTQSANRPSASVLNLKRIEERENPEIRFTYARKRKS